MRFTNLDPAPPDAILGLTEAFKRDPRPEKINLGVGVFMDDSGQTPVLTSVRRAEERLLAEEDSKSYLPIAGSPGYATGVQELLFGGEHPLLEQGRAGTVQTPGGTGGLRVGMDFLQKLNPEASLWMSSPTWANHKGVAAAAGFAVKEYPYYDAQTMSLDFDAMKNALRSVPSGDVVLLHVCCHNPTGVDPTPEQWQEIADLAEAGGWFPFFDFAYQGFGESLEDDRAPLLLFAERNLEFAVAGSFSKNFGLYGERTGSFTLVAESSAATEAALSHVKKTVRVLYSNPPRHGAALVEIILNDDSLRAEWEQELTGMRNHILDLRTRLVAGMKSRGVEGDFEKIARQRGMFSFSGLSESQVHLLRDNHAIYMVDSGRMNVAGIQGGSLERVCDALAAVL